ncbi:MAG: 23S rRNA (uracil(1939)-C(5))-methyltransferase RlmD [Calditrichaeota bacterium]|nr:23S rRNA (uracil(1939)-C(5))-methyltransferase RlmD [Calditrichota bacterium]RQW05346.1 MAG: 23S rRNA (uracil(1939)-C(5))-methyltransferase RlmD [Calditrichota bacterium]
MKKGELLTINIDKLAFGGKGIARVDNRVVFVEGGLPGDRAEVKIQKVKKKHIDARITDVIKPSPLRREAECSHFGQCGGCKWQNLDYRHQVQFKREQLLESFRHLAGLTPEVIHQTTPSPLIFAYRNKMEFSFTDNRWLVPEELADPRIKKDFALGLHVPGSYDRVMHIEKCWLQDDVMNRILNFSQNYFKQSGLPVFNLKTHEGLLRFLVLRKSFSHGEYMVNIVTFRPAESLLADYANKLNSQFPEITSIINTVNPRVAQIAFGEEEYVLSGQDHITEKMDEFTFEISANSFFQTNPLQAVHLYHTVQKYAGRHNNLIWDLYSGTGTIAMFLAGNARKVKGFELVESAVMDARNNCAGNSIDNCEFIAGDIRDNISGTSDNPDIIVCDPPRSGMHEDILKAIMNKRPQKIVYVSCNPATMARDIQQLTTVYQVAEIQPIDMFPHTYHIESVARLELK